MTEEFCVDLDGRLGYKRARIFPLQGLSVGSYGSVYMAALDELPCAAKILRSTFFGTRDSGAVNIASRFEQECRFLSDLKHPNLVQLLGFAHEPRSACPILLMELMDESLTQFLKRQTCHLSLNGQVNLTHDVTLALAYLHSSDIVHGNLCSNNVLVTRSRAKVTDFGMFKMNDFSPHMIPITKSTDSQPFMPPETFLTCPTYSIKVDIFSAGVLIVQIVTREFPTPTKSKRIEKFSASPTGVIEVPVPERERRNNDIIQISPTHPLLPVALDCLKDKQEDRPSASQLCQMLAALKEVPSCSENLHEGVEGATVHGNISSCTSLEKGRDIDSDEVLDNLQEKNAQLQVTLLHLAERDKIIQAKEEMLKAMNEEIQWKSQEVAQLQRKLEEKDEELAKLDRLAEEKQSHKVSIEQYKSPLNIPLLPEEKLQLKWQVKKNAPILFYGGTTAVIGNTVFFLAYNMNEIHCYLLNEDQWKIKLKFPRFSAALAIIRGLLTGIGGGTNIVTSWNENGWEEVFPAMSVQRSQPAVENSGDYTIVVGGQGPNNEHLTSIEVFSILSNTWAIIADTPVPFTNINTTFCGDRLYVASYDRNLSMYSILLRFSEPKIGTNLSLELSTKSKWRQHVDNPTYHSSLSTIGNQVVLVGGMINCDSKSQTGDVFGLDNGHWVKIGCMQSARIQPIVAVLSGNRMLALGGHNQSRGSDALELAVLC